MEPVVRQIRCLEDKICTNESIQLRVEIGLNTSVPAGAKSVTISNLSGITTINGLFQIGTGRRPNSIDFGTSIGNCINETLPEYILAGGTWQWIAHFE